ncbi:MAG: hypothetical protein ACK5X0_23295 [Rhodospirillales bacterium]
MRPSLRLRFQRNKLAGLPDVDGNMSKWAKFKVCSIRSIHIDIAEVRTRADNLHLFVAFEGSLWGGFAELHQKFSRLRMTLLLLLSTIARNTHDMRGPTAKPSAQTGRIENSGFNRRCDEP